MEGSISSDDGRDDPDFGIICFCGEPAPLTKSETQKNPGRRFFGCTNYKVSCRQKQRLDVSCCSFKPKP
ncbi:hypothetical protein RHGRI_015567 [Rhododendron griersonianum]|uniref:Zinc finger GRF-type domain-containing protein n=1 Tax=Rhododendron griersonianum TaxID=479676 RepID=A0AAV6KEP7_9ERIC|nr:hypothetical protein RHGRI_015567 [Rhododendron griersonianum]